MQTKTQQELASGIQTRSFGENGGDKFGLAVVSEIGLQSGDFIDQIRINGVDHGGGGGRDNGSITLGPDEYISKVEISAGEFIDKVKFTTNEGRSIEGGGGGGVLVTLENIRVIAIGGRAGEVVDKITIMYVNDYTPSTVEAKNVGFILAFSPPFEEFEEYESSVDKTADSYEQVTEHVINQTYSASVEGEYYAKVAASTQIEIKDSSLRTVRQELQTELNRGTKKTQKIPEGHVGVKLVTATLMKGARVGINESFWMYPSSAPSYSVIKTTDIDNVLDHYDLTGQLDTQMEGLQKHTITKNGFVFYSRSE